MKLFQLNDWTEPNIPSYNLSFFLGKEISLLRVVIDCDRHSYDNRYLCFSFTTYRNNVIPNFVEIEINFILFASVGIGFKLFERKLEADA
jgi:hypothetical protein